tara:strand:- start:257 stop:451 length:195 start_codon:yes stop_codon:yes gene_type:complete
MGNVCASTRNKECLYSIKEPQVIKNAFNDCIAYRKCEITKSKLKKQKRKYTRKLIAIEEQLNDY